MKPLVLYSANTLLAYQISKTFFQDQHYVWCTPYFDCPAGIGENLPPSSTPKEIGAMLAKAVANVDRHDLKIESVKTGLRRGTTLKRQAGVITQHEEDVINQIVAEADVALFRPLVYVIPYQKVAKIIADVPVADRASPFSVEFIIEKLPKTHFDIIQPWN